MSSILALLLVLSFVLFVVVEVAPPPPFLPAPPSIERCVAATMDCGCFGTLCFPFAFGARGWYPYLTVFSTSVVFFSSSSFFLFSSLRLVGDLDENVLLFLPRFLFLPSLSSLPLYTRSRRYSLASFSASSPRLDRQIDYYDDDDLGFGLALDDPVCCFVAALCLSTETETETANPRASDSTFS